MPKLNGFDTTLKMRETHPILPIIALSAADIDPRLDNLKKLGLNGLVSKPFKIDILFAEIAYQHIQHQQLLSTAWITQIYCILPIYIME